MDTAIVEGKGHVVERIMIGAWVVSMDDKRISKHHINRTNTSGFPANEH